jgi:ABC-type multidrug transport system permease subunit
MAESLSPLETQVVGFLAWAINQMFCKQVSSSRDGSSQRVNVGLTQAIHILSDSASKPIERWQAIKALTFMAIRAIVILCCLAIVVRIGTAVGRVLGIMLWPVSIVWVIVKWMLGLA